MKWPLWLGIILPAGLLHVLTWLLLLVSPLIHRKHGTENTLSSKAKLWVKEVAAIGSILFLFELAWGIQLPMLSTSPTVATAAALQSVFIVASAFLGFSALLHFCFLQPGDRKRKKPARDSSSYRESSPERNSLQEPITPSSVDTIEVISLPNFTDENENIVSKLADL